MYKKISLIGHISTVKSPIVRKACKLLFEKTNITYFCYLRRYKDGSFTFLPSMIDVGSYMFEDCVYPDTWFAGFPFEELKSGYMFWEITKQINSEETDKVSETLKQSFHLSAGIEIIEKSKDYCEFYSFSGSNSDIYFVPKPFLYRFIYYFKQTCRLLLLEACQNRLQLYNKTFVLPYNPIMSVDANATETEEVAFDIKRYYLSGKYEDVFLTKREVEILEKIEQGYIVKDLANLLCISPRTIEHHITNIKEKLNVSRTTEMLHIVRACKIIV